MDKLENVIKGLEESYQQYSVVEGQGILVDHDSYEYALIDPVLIIDAIAMLKAQEPETSDAPKPDSDIGCWYDITHNYTLEQIVSALKAQEPRVMTWDELITTDHVYIETNKDGQKYIVPGIVAIVRDTAVIISVRIGTRLIDGTIDKDVYGIECRCWTSRPDEKRRAETPWESVK